MGPGIIVVLLTMTVNNNTIKIHNQHLFILKMARQLALPVISFVADGAALELTAQNLMHSETLDMLPFKYYNSRYGVSIKIPVFQNTEPLISITDPPHTVKTIYNQP